MTLNNYKAINNYDIRKIFLDYIYSLEIPVIDYIAIGVQNTVNKTSASLMSNLEWQKKFFSLNLASHDPVRKAALNTRVKMFAFDELDYQDSYGKEIMRQRRMHGIEQGLVLMKRNLGHNFMFTLASGYKNLDAYKFFAKHRQAIFIIFADLISLISPYTRFYHSEITTHQIGDAK